MSQTINKAMRLLDLFSVAEPEWSVSETARALELPKSTTSELMSGLAKERLLSHTPVRGRYRLGWRLFELGQTMLDTTDFRLTARRVMEELVRRWGETVHLAVLDDVQAVYIDKLQPSPAVKISITRAGARLPAHASGVGKVLLAHAEWERVVTRFEDQGMPALTSNTICTLEGLEHELELVRERGYAYDHEESMLGLCCVAAPIYDSKGEVIAAVSFSVPAYRFLPESDAYTEAILDAARRISENADSGSEEYSGYEVEKDQREDAAKVKNSGYEVEEVKNT